ncbi:Cytochrome C biogenesis protein transmembrane region [Corynebacterium ciconiae DSM 44920]|uniref:cytochrome c biogenesis CcdA family protein n=1 Tax=Corynebacterium ciconiae TaxID=227319 RepID=UPI00037F4069|nr:cytochrome c biogenesis CcdA family protein [Corynebacterium ciconiae]WKD62164.1 Cytochrome C biogenesis protein transmembrane region [Corynebacterium ciconiae DSM 44920]
MTSIGLFGAIIAGVLSILSPCSALLLPAFFAYAFSSRTELITRTAVFFLGLVVVLAPIGAGAGALGQWLSSERDTLITVGGIIMILLGVFIFFGGGFQIPGMSSLAGKVGMNAAGWIPTFLLGAVYGFAGFCAGPMLGAVLTTAFVASNVVYGMAIMAAYALGMTLPLFLLAALWEKFNIGEAAWLRGKKVQLGPLTLNSTSMIAGVFFIILGVLYMATNATTSLGGLLSTDTQANIQLRVATLLMNINGAMVLLFVLSIIALVLAYKSFTVPAKDKD